MDFFERQDKARRNTKLLVFYFSVAVLLLTIAIYFAVYFIFVGIRTKTGGGPVSVWNFELLGWVALSTLGVIFFGSFFKTMQLSKGGSAVATMLGGRLVNSGSADEDERKLLNVVEEMALAAGIPVPEVYVMDDETGINAFAAGHSTSDAVVGVTRGCIKLLNRDELQGVIAHEFSHILNGDMRLNLRLMGIIFGIVCITVIGRILLRSGTRSRYHLGARKKGGNPLPLLGLALILIGWIGVLFGRLIQAAVSRQREFLADASAVQFTRNPGGIGGALRKIGGLAYGSKLESEHAEEASHMFFGNALGQSLAGLFATHPPLPERIRAIDPNFDGTFPPVSVAELETMPSMPRRGAAAADIPFPFPFPFPAMPPKHAAMSGMMPSVIPARSVMPNVGQPNPAHLRYAIDMRNSFPPGLTEAARNPLGAAALTYALLLSSDAAIRAKQLELLAQVSTASRQETERLLPHVEGVAINAKLPLVDLALPAMRHFSPLQYQEFSRALEQLVECDGEIDLFEYMLQKIVLRHLDPQFKGPRKQAVQYYALKPLLGDCAVLLSAVAYAGQEDLAKAREAFVRGAYQLSQQAQTELPFLAEAQCDLPQVDAALNRLSQAVPQIKKNVLNACAQAVAADEVIQEMEAELLRAIADALECPMPPFVQPKAA